MAFLEQAGTRPGSRAKRRLAHRGALAALFLLVATDGLIAQEGKWTYAPTTDLLTDLRNDAVWTDSVVPASPAYRLGVTCDDTEYVSVFVRSDSEMASINGLRVRFDGGVVEVLSVERSLASSNRLSFEPAGAALRRILASKKMVLSLQNRDLQEVSVQFDLTGLDAVVKQMPLKCQERLGERLAEGKPAPKSSARPSRAP